MKWIEADQLNMGNIFYKIFIIQDINTLCFRNVETYPVFTQNLKDVRCCDGDSVTLECHVEGLPEPSIVWEKDGRVLSNSTDYRTNYLEDRATLHISSIFPEDEGEYTCVAINNIGKAYTSACIIVDGMFVYLLHI